MPIPLLAPLLGGAVSWVFRTVIVKSIMLFVIITMMGILAGAIFKLIELCCDISENSLNSMFNLIPPEIWFFLDWLQVPYGFKVILSAVVVRFMISLVPFVGKQ